MCSCEVGSPAAALGLFVAAWRRWQGGEMEDRAGSITLHSGHLPGCNNQNGASLPSIAAYCVTRVTPEPTPSISC